MLNTTDLSIFLPEDEIKHIKEQDDKMLITSKFSIRHFAKLRASNISLSNGMLWVHNKATTIWH